MNHKGLGILLFLAFFFSARAAGPAAAGIEPLGAEIEPNDDIHTATFIKWINEGKPEAFRSGTIDRPGDVDFYWFYPHPLDTLAVEWQQWGSPVAGRLSLYDSSGNLLAEADCAGTGICLRYVFVLDNNSWQPRYYLKVSNAGGAGGPDFAYQFTLNYLGKTDPNEPNDTPATATPINVGEWRSQQAALVPCDENDYYAFDAAAEGVIQLYAPPWQLFDANLTMIAEGSTDWESRYVDLPAAGRYFLRVFNITCDPNSEESIYELYDLNITVSDPEPNDTPAQAIPISYGYGRSGWFWPSGAGDVDFYRFDGRAGDDIEVYAWVSKQLLDGQGNTIAEGEGNLYVTLPVDGPYYLRLSSESEWADSYYLNLTLLGHSEPNDAPAQAAPIAYDQAVEGLISCTDVDYFTFAGRAGEEVLIEQETTYSWMLPYYQLLDHNQQVVAEIHYDWSYYPFGIRVFLPETGTYYLRVSEDDCADSTPVYVFTLERVIRPLYLSFNKAGALQGVRFTAGDVLRYDPATGRLEMYADLSDLGLNGNLTALDYLNYSLLLGFAARYTLPGLGPVQPQDLVSVDLLASGQDTTAYPVMMQFDGARVGLTTSSERLGAVAAINWEYPQRLFLATTGRARVPAEGYYTLENEDLPWFTVRDDGFYTAGDWRPYFDGSLYGLGPAAIAGADVDKLRTAGGDALWLSFNQAVTFGGVRLDPGDIAVCFERWGEDDRCDSITKYFDASDAGFGSYRIDALEVGD